MARLGIVRAKEACRTAGRLWMALLPYGHALRGGHDRVVRDIIEFDIGRVAVRVATCCAVLFGRARRRACGAEASREDSSLEIIVAPSVAREYVGSRHAPNSILYVAM